MSLIKDLSPMINSMRIFGLFPPVMNSIANENGVFVKRSPNYMAILFQLICINAAWFDAARYFTLFFFGMSFTLVDVLFALELISYHAMGAIVRTAFVYIHWRSNGWLKMVEYLNEAERAHDNADALSLLAKLQNAYRKHRPRAYLTVALWCWAFVAANAIFLATAFQLKRVTFLPGNAPFHVLANTEEKWAASTAGFTLLNFIVDSANCFTNAFIAMLTMEYASKFHMLEKWIHDISHKRPSEVVQVPSSNMHAMHEQDPNVETIDTSVIKEQQQDQQSPRPKSRAQKQNAPPSSSSSRSEEVEGLRKSHLYLIHGVRLLDSRARLIVGASMAFGFFGLIVNVLQMAWGTNDMLLRFGWIIWLAIWGSVMFCHLFTSSYLHKKTQHLQEAFFTLPDEMYKSGQQVNVVLGQFTTEPISLTFFGIIFLRAESIMELCGALFTHFLILVDYTAGEKRNAAAAASAVNGTAVVRAEG